MFGKIEQDTWVRIIGDVPVTWDANPSEVEFRIGTNASGIDLTADEAGMRCILENVGAALLEYQHLKADES